MTLEKHLHYTSDQHWLKPNAPSLKRSLNHSEAISHTLPTKAFKMSNAAFGSAIPSTSGGNAGGAVIQMAPVAAGPTARSCKLTRRKSQSSTAGEKDKATLTILGWCCSIDGMKDALIWSDKSTYANPFHCPVRECPKDSQELGYPLQKQSLEDMDIPQKEDAYSLLQHAILQVFYQRHVQHLPKNGHHRQP